MATLQIYTTPEERLSLARAASLRVQNLTDYGSYGFISDDLRSAFQGCLDALPAPFLTFVATEDREQTVVNFLYMRTGTMFKEPPPSAPPTPRIAISGL